MISGRGKVFLVVLVSVAITAELLRWKEGSESSDTHISLIPRNLFVNLKSTRTRFDEVRPVDLRAA
jgi:hypothetical protein